MRIAVMTDHPALQTGVARVTRGIIKHQEDHEWPMLVRGFHDAQDASDVVTGVEGDITPGLSQAGSQGILAWLRRTEPDCLLLIGDPGTFPGLVEAEREVRKVCPVVYYHVWDNNPSPEWNRPLYSVCTQIAAASELTERVVTDATEGRQSPLYVPHGVDLDTFKPSDPGHFEEVAERPSILYVGANQHRKNLAALVAAFKGASAVEGALLVMRTDPDGAYDVRGAARALGIEDRLRVIGPVSDLALASLYSAATAVVNPAYREGFGLTTLEAAACGTPRISACTGGLEDQIKALHGHASVRSHVSMSGDQTVPLIKEERVDLFDLEDRIQYELEADDRFDAEAERQAIRDAGMTEQGMSAGIERAIQRAVDTHERPNRYYITSA
jgi:glycosyltransferase involved in cell wall biosynthesis